MAKALAADRYKCLAKVSWSGQVPSFRLINADVRNSAEAVSRAGFKDCRGERLLSKTVNANFRFQRGLYSLLFERPKSDTYPTCMMANRRPIKHLPNLPPSQLPGEFRFE